MPKRKAVEVLEAEDSDLSPPPDDLVNEKQAVAGANGNADGERPIKKRKGRAANIKTAAVLTQEELVVSEVKPAKQKRGKKETVKIEVKEETVEEQAVDGGGKSAPKKPRKRKQKLEEEAAEQLDEKGDIIKKKIKVKRKSKAEKEAELVDMPLAARTVGHKLYIGAHVSAAGGVHQSILNSVHIGANAFALFLKSQRKWVNPPLLDDHCSTFHKHCKDHVYDQAKHAVPHGSYLVNLAHTDKARTQQAYESFVDDLKRCERLGITLYNFHPGNDQCGDRQKAISHLASNINRAHGETKTVVTLLENMAAGGNVLGSTFEDLRDIIALVSDKDRVGVCLDTCHAFAAGYDLRAPAAFKDTMDHFEDIVGFQYLRAMHINDSKAPFAAHKDLHQNIGCGFLGLRAFHNVVNEPRFAGLPLVLETPIDVYDEEGKLVKDENGKAREDKGIWAREIKLLESMVGMDVESEDFLAMETKLAKQGEPERTRLLDQIARVKVKKEKKASSTRKKKGKAVEEDEEVEEGDADSALSELEESDGEP